MRHLLLAAALVLVAAVARATPGTAAVLLYAGAGQGRVVFDGRLHASRGLTCDDCHASRLFATKKQALLTMDDHGSGRACWACHDGKRAFGECAGCHRK